MKIKLARTISLVLGFPWIVIMVLILLFTTGLNVKQIKFFGSIFLFLHFAIPFIYIIWALKKGKISDIDMTKREERFEILTLVFLKNTISFILIWIFGTTLLVKLAAIIFVVSTFVYVITFFWKISFHMTFNTLGITLINLISGFDYWYIYLLIPIVFWARLTLKKHTLNQLVAGFVVNEAIMLSLAFWFGLIHF